MEETTSVVVFEVVVVEGCVVVEEDVNKVVDATVIVVATKVEVYDVVNGVDVFKEVGVVKGIDVDLEKNVVVSEAVIDVLVEVDSRKEELLIRLEISMMVEVVSGELGASVGTVDFSGIELIMVGTVGASLELDCRIF